MICGIGERKLARYGEPFLAVIRAYCAECGLTEHRRLPNALPGSGAVPAGERSMTIGAAFAAGSSAAELQALYGVKQSTIVDHLYRYVRSGHTLDPKRVLALSGLDADTRTRVLAAFAEHGLERLRPIFDALECTVSYDELHVLRLYVLCRAAGTEHGERKRPSLRL